MNCMFFSLLFADTVFLAKEKAQILKQEGDVKTRQSPCSTFKIAISLMGFDASILTDETHPALPFKDGYVTWIDNWKQSHTPSLWLKNSCVWYSQVITQQLGMGKFQQYVTNFNYGNQDVSGDEGKDNGITISWLSSSLKISPEEQTIFLQNLVDNKLPVSPKAHQMTKNIMFLEDLSNGWKLYGKTGGLVEKGWFVGWIENGKRTIVFASYVDGAKEEIRAPLRAKATAKEKLMQLVTAK